MKINRFSCRSKMKSDNAGTTLVEMIISFMLLSIFMVSAATIITLIANMYYAVKGESYSNQVADIVLEKVVSEIEGAKYDSKRKNDSVKIASDNSSISLSDRTDTDLTLYAADGRLKIDYAQITNLQDTSLNRNATTWELAKDVYNGYTVNNLRFFSGSKVGTFANAKDYGLDPDSVSYGDDVVVVFLSLHSEQYTDYKTFRVVKMYNMK